MGTSSSGKLEDWATGVDFVVNQTTYVLGVATGFNDKMYKCLVAHTSNTFVIDFGNSYWRVVQTKGDVGPAGSQGVKGDDGAVGATGAGGAGGSNGSNGIFSAIASTAEAEAGTNNTKGMSPLRVNEAIAALANVPSAAQIAQIDTNTAAISAVSGRVSVIESAFPLTTATGKQPLLNNQAATVDILGSESPSGFGNRLELSSIGAKSAVVELELYRKDDGEERLTLVTLRLVFLPSSNTWYQARQDTIDLIDGNPDGITFGVSTTADGEGGYVAQINYISTNMSGGNYASASYIKFRLQRIIDTF